MENSLNLRQGHVVSTDLRWDRSIVRDNVRRMNEMTTLRDTIRGSGSGNSKQCLKWNMEQPNCLSRMCLTLTSC